MLDEPETFSDPRRVIPHLSPLGLFGKLLLIFATLVVLPFAMYSGINFWFAYDEQRATLAQVQRSNAQIAAQRIAQFIKEIEGQLSWTTLVPLQIGTLEARRLDALRVLRQSPAIVDLALVDAQGKERVSVSRVSLDRLNSGIDRSMEQALLGASRDRVYYGPVNFRRETEPFMTLAVAGSRREFGVAIADVNLKLIRDVVSGIQVGREGKAWVVDRAGRLVAHPDISLVLSNMDLSQRVRSIVELADAADRQDRVPRSIEGLQGGRVLARYAKVEPMGWIVVVELPETEADEPLWRALSRAFWIAAASLILSALLAVLLARQVVRPIRTLAAGARQLGARDFKHRIDLGTGDELDDLGRQFNQMAAEIESSYAQLEAKVAERTRELALANEAKSRFLAIASHDLRQPLHALSLLVGQLDIETDPVKREQVAQRIARAVDGINRLFDGLLDISKLDAGVIAPVMADVPLGPILQQVHARYADDADAKGLRLLMAPSHAWVRTDPQMLERVIQNLVGNAVRYTEHGGVVFGCRWGAQQVRVEVWDSGPGIPSDQTEQIFGEFYQLDRSHQRRGDGLGLGLAIVERLCGLLKHPITLRSESGKGSCFAVTVPRVPAQRGSVNPPTPPAHPSPFVERLVLIIDDDDLVRESTGGLFASWGCAVVVAGSTPHALRQLDGRVPDLIVSDFHLAGGEQASKALDQLRRAFNHPVPTVLITGDLSAPTRALAASLNIPLLDKPVRPIALRAVASRLLQLA